MQKFVEKLLVVGSALGVQWQVDELRGDDASAEVSGSIMFPVTDTSCVIMEFKSDLYLHEPRELQEQGFIAAEYDMDCSKLSCALLALSRLEEEVGRSRAQERRARVQSERNRTLSPDDHESDDEVDETLNNDGCVASSEHDAWGSGVDHFEGDEALDDDDEDDDW
nr:hypothetical protein [uncultured Sphingomonas sp.]